MTAITHQIETNILSVKWLNDQWAFGGRGK
jgi:hypothetical protein